MSLGNIDRKLKVLFIAGAGRSGSTLLEKFIGGLNGVAALGEVSFIWERGFDSNQLCGCGKRFGDCETWQKIRLAAFYDETKINVNWLVKATRYIQRTRRLLQFHCSPLFPKFNSLVESYANNFFRLYKGAAKVHKAHVLIDSSKHVHGYVLSTIPDIDLYVLHLVRDARATAYSWTRKKVFQKGIDKTIYFQRYRPWFGATVWFFDNLSAELMRLRCKNYLRVRYEDFCEDPQRVIKQILTFINEDDLSSPVLKSFDSGLQHSVSGNPVRYKHGKIVIKNDREWESEMSKTTQRIVALITLPMLYRYGYILKNFSFLNSKYLK